MREELSFVAVGQWPSEFAHVLEAIQEIRPRRLLEIGVCEGRWIWQVAPACQPGFEYVGVDPAPHPNWKRTEAALTREGANVRLINEPSATALKELYLSDPALFQVIHIDGNHHPQAVMFDYDFSSPMVRPGGVIILHDVYSGKGPGEALRTILSSEHRKGIIEVSTFFDPSQGWDMGVAILRMK